MANQTTIITKKVVLPGGGENLLKKGKYLDISWYFFFYNLTHSNALAVSTSTGTLARLVARLNLLTS